MSRQRQTGILANVDGIQIDAATGQVINSGPIDLAASSGMGSASGDGIEINDLAGSLTNTGAIRMQMDGNTNASADVIEVLGLSGHLENSGALTVGVTTTNGGAFFDIIEVTSGSGGITGSVNNTATLNGMATGSCAGADGFDVGEMASAATFTNSGTVNVLAKATSRDANADALDFGDIFGTATNSGALQVRADGVTSARVRGIEAVNVDGSLSNSGSISVRAEATSGRPTAAGILADDVSGSVTNTGALSVTAVSPSGANATGIEAGDFDGHSAKQRRYVRHCERAEPGRAGHSGAGYRKFRGSEQFRGSHNQGAERIKR